MDGHNFAVKPKKSNMQIHEMIRLANFILSINSTQTELHLSKLKFKGHAHRGRIRLHEGGAMAQRLERSFPLPGVLGSNPIGDKNFWGFRYEINQHLEGFLRVLRLPPSLQKGYWTQPTKIQKSKTYLKFPFLIAV